MGITCAVAWELPSKPPSEIVENFRDKLNDGTYGLTRRNDTLHNNIKYVDNTNNDFAVNSPATMKTQNLYQNSYTNQKSVPTPTDPYYNFNNNYNNGNSSSTAVQLESNALYANPYETTKTAAVNQALHPATYSTHYQAYNVGDNSAKYSFDKTQSKTLYGNRADTPTHSKYYKTTNGVSGISGYKYADKQKFTDWHRQGNTAKTTNNVIYGYNQRQQQQKHQQQQHQQQQQRLQQSLQLQSAVNTKYEQGHPGWSKHNWWETNKQRIESDWREKQHKWAKYESVQPEKSTTTKYNAPIYAPIRTGRNRKVLQNPPKHRIYPVFGKKRRRRRAQSQSSGGRDRNLLDFELKMERIHLHEHVQSRQILYRKIEKLFQAHGHNGTACVLRALCETGQRHFRTEPQTFIMELLRAIFVLPKDMPPAVQERITGKNVKTKTKVKPHIATHYSNAYGTQTNCGELFTMCEHSIWSDFEFKM
ncbi:protein kinase 4-like [Teleopsis dalmanni]|uniref:protein kinase 4-like n=1 Tax=Teleopsis dalmanni TaxID=139649 RepID=UPI0018CE6F6F|nr:protein kinase 4-like [Teleopsis dalmanni]